jgi:YVTN family beta-propeller protein
VIDLTSTPAHLLQTIAIGTAPVGISFAPNGRYIYVTNSTDNTVSVIDPTTDTVVPALGSPIAVGGRPTAFGQFLAPSASTPSPEPATKLAFTQQPPATVSAGQAFAAPIKVAIEDANGNVVAPGFTSVVYLSTTGGPGTLSCPSTTAPNAQPASQGVATFGGCTLRACLVNIPKDVQRPSAERFACALRVERPAKIGSPMLLTSPSRFIRQTLVRLGRTCCMQPCRRLVGP